MRDLGVVLSQCAHVVVPHEEDSFEFDPEEELDIAGDDNGDSDETDDDYVPEGGSGSSGESDGEGGEIQEEGMGTIQRGAGKIHKKGVGKIQKEGAGEILKEGVGVTPKEGKGSGLGKGMQGSKRKCSATPLPPRSPGVHIKAKMPVQTMHRAEGMVQRENKKNEVGTTIGRCYRCKECTFQCATRAACVAHACRKHTDELIGPCDYCGAYYAHLADSMRHHVNECAGRTTSSDNTDDKFFPSIGPRYAPCEHYLIIF